MINVSKVLIALVFLAPRFVSAQTDSGVSQEVRVSTKHKRRHKKHKHHEPEHDQNSRDTERGDHGTPAPVHEGDLQGKGSLPPAGGPGGGDQKKLQALEDKHAAAKRALEAKEQAAIRFVQTDGTLSEASRKTQLSSIAKYFQEQRKELDLQFQKQKENQEETEGSGQGSAIEGRASRASSGVSKPATTLDTTPTPQVSAASEKTGAAKDAGGTQPETPPSVEAVSRRYHFFSSFEEAAAAACDPAAVARAKSDIANLQQDIASHQQAMQRDCSPSYTQYYGQGQCNLDKADIADDQQSISMDQAFLARCSGQRKCKPGKVRVGGRCVKACPDGSSPDARGKCALEGLRIIPPRGPIYAGGPAVIFKAELTPKNHVQVHLVWSVSGNPVVAAAAHREEGGASQPAAPLSSASQVPAAGVFAIIHGLPGDRASLTPGLLPGPGTVAARDKVSGKSASAALILEQEEGNLVRMHVQLHGESGAGTQRFRQEKPNVDRALAQEMLTRLRKEAQAGLGNKDLDGFFGALKQASHFLAIAVVHTGRNHSFSYGTRGNRIDVEIRGTYPYVSR